jgi:polyphosphate kinase 2 (PPK2 family)
LKLIHIKRRLPSPRSKTLEREVRVAVAKGRTKGRKYGDDGATSRGKLDNKTYERELARLHAELVKLQLWAVYKGLKACVVFECRDGAGKGGVIKAITERVSPRVFRVVALPAPTEREKSQMYMLHAAFSRRGRDRSLRPQLVQSRLRRARDGLLLDGAGEAVPTPGSWSP